MSGISQLQAVNISSGAMIDPDQFAHKNIFLNENWPRPIIASLLTFILTQLLFLSNPVVLFT